MPGTALPIELSTEEKSAIDSLIRSPQTRQGQVVRLKVVLRAHEGCSNRNIADLLRIGLSAVLKWRARFATRGLAGLRDLPA
jgi:hypothetical protein